MNSFLSVKLKLKFLHWYQLDFVGRVRPCHTHEEGRSYEPFREMVEGFGGGGVGEREAVQVLVEPLSINFVFTCLVVKFQNVVYLSGGETILIDKEVDKFVLIFPLILPISRGLKLLLRIFELLL